MTSRRIRSSTTSAGCGIWSRRSFDRLAIRTSASWRIRCACSAPPWLPLGALDRRAAAAHSAGHPRHVERVSFGMLQVAKKDLERLRHMNMLLPRLADPTLPPRVIRNLPHRPAFPDAMSWLEIYGDSP